MPAEPATSPNVPSERDLVDRARAGDREALGGLFDLYYTAVYRYVLAKLGNPTEAEDVASEVFMRVAEYIGRFQWREEATFQAWLFRIASNQVNTHYRRQTTRTVHISTDDIDIEDSALGPEGRMLHAVTMDEVAAACKRLPPLQQQVIFHRFAAGRSVRETAEALGKTENNVKVLQHKAIAKLQKLLRNP